MRRGMAKAMESVKTRALDDSERVISDPKDLEAAYSPDKELTFEVRRHWQCDERRCGVSMVCLRFE